jgi:hypothetical protein
VPTCAHLTSTPLTAPPAGSTSDSRGPECSDCVAVGGRWVHLRRCLTCDHVACCDSSPARHATAHAKATGHPVITSAEPGETWRWCYVDEVGA